MRLWLMKHAASGILISLSLAAFAASAHAASPPADGKGSGVRKEQQAPPTSAPATANVQSRRGALIDPDGR